MSEKDLSHHYKFLRQFLDVSDDSNGKGKSTSVRAAKAREKLLKLSEAQFKELSTDVYDELRRRIDESRGEPDYLLPKSSFHPKRNQARQKLSSLPQSRFKDLVSDISFEIKRRDLHSSISDESGELARSAPDVEASRNESAHPNGGPDQSEGTNKGAESILNKTIGVQSRTVIPNKTDLAWSSDEEDENGDGGDEGHGYNSNGMSHNHATKEVDGDGPRDEEVSRLTQACLEKDQQIEELRDDLKSLREKKTDVEDMYRTLQREHEKSRSEAEELDKSNNILKKEKQALSNQTSSKGVDQVVSKEFDNLKAANAALRLEIQSLKNSASTRETNHMKNNSLDSLSSASRSSSVTLKNDLKKNMELFFEKLSNLDASKTSSRGSTYVELRNDVTRWQNKYEELRSGQVSDDLKTSLMSKEELNTFVSPTGLISIKLVSEFHAMVESFFLYLNGSAFDSDILFERVSRISVAANEIAAQGDNHNLNSNENSIYLREAVSYALTATRYFAVYSKVFPKFVLERALGEVCFTVCDLITVSKLNGDSVKGMASRTVRDNNASKNVAGAVNENFSARPLRIANKVKEIPKENDESEGLHNRDINSKHPINTKALSSSSPLRQREPAVAQPKEPKLTSPTRPSISNGHSSDHEEVKTGNENSKDFEPESPQEEVTKVVVSKNGILGENSLRGGSDGSNNVTARSVSGSLRAKGPKTADEEIERSPKSKNISALASRFEQQPEPQASSTKSSPSAKGAGVAYLASRLSASSDNNSSKSSSANTTPTKKNIFERVRQFENSTEKKQYTERGSPSSTISGRKMSAGFDSDDSYTSQGSRKPSSETKVPERLSKPFKVSESNGMEKNINTNGTEVGRSLTADETGDDTAINSKNLASTQNISKNGFEKNGSKNGNRNSNEMTTPETVASSLISHTKNSPDNSESITSEENSTNSIDKSKSDLHNLPKNESKPPTKKSVKYAEDVSNDEGKNDSDEEIEAKQRQEYRKSVAAANFNVDLFDIDDPDNTLTQVLLYLEHQTVEVIATIQSLLSAIKKPSATRGELRDKSSAITTVISQMTEATNTSMNQTRNAQLKEHGNWVVKSLEDCHHRMHTLCKPNSDRKDSDFADKNFKQRLAGISFDIAKCTKELVKTVEEASIKEEIAHLDARLSHADDLT